MSEAKEKIHQSKFKDPVCSNLINRAFYDYLIISKFPCTQIEYKEALRYENFFFFASTDLESYGSSGSKCGLGWSVMQTCTSRSVRFLPILVMK